MLKIPSHASSIYYLHRLRTWLVTALILGGSWWVVPPLLAASAPPGALENKATGSFETEGNSTETAIESNTVTVSIVEVAGINISVSQLPEEAPAGVPLAGPSQGNGTINPGDIVYFYYTLTNVGNDPTQFFIPGAPTIAPTDGTFDATKNPIAIVAYDPDGSGTTAPSVPVNIPVPATGGQTGAVGLLGTNGIVPPGGTVTIRVPIKVVASAGSAITVRIGDTGANNNLPATQNQPYAIGTGDVYTVDNPNGTVGETNNPPFNGEREASLNQQVAIVAPLTIAGQVFEDINYGGGAGRASTVAGATPRDGATVELYQGDGTYISNTVTSGGGNYAFANIVAGDYYVRVVNSTVTSARPGAVSTLIPVQTFRTNAGVTAGTVTSVTDRVGGEKPNEVDAPANTTQTLAALNGVAGQEVQSVTAVKVGSSSITGVDFGFNFDTIVNTNNSGQGSLNQFIVNSNALANSTLNQDPNPSPAPGTTAIDPPPGQETSIFMIPAAQLTGGVAVINISSLLPSITGINAANTAIDGRTQTVNMGNTNNIILGSGGQVGVDRLNLSQLNGPEVEINGLSSLAAGLDIQANNISVQGIAILKFGKLSTTNANINITATAANPVITGNVIGTTARSFTDPISSGTRSNAYGIYSYSTTGYFANNLIGFHGRGGIELMTAGSGILITNNEVRGNAINDSRAEGTNILNGGGVTVNGNLFTDSGGPGIDTSGSSGNNTYINNTVTNNGRNLTGQVDPQTAGMRIQGSNTVIDRNIIANNYGAGILVRDTNSTTAVTITKNSIYDNGIVSGQIGIDLVETGGNGDRGTAPFVTPNDNGDPDTGANGLLNFPVVQSAELKAGNLVVKGFAPAGSSIELFIADPGANPGAGVKPAAYTSDFGEGKTYLATVQEGGTSDLDATSGTYTNDGTGSTGSKTENRFEFSIPLASGNVLNGQTISAGLRLTSTATVNKSTSEFSGVVPITAPLTTNPSVLLVKRITAIDGNVISSYINDPANPYDDNVLEPLLAPNLPNYPTADTDKWPNTPNANTSTFLLGSINGGTVKPNDTIEYTIYFLSAGTRSANSVLFCDRVPSNVTFIPSAFNTIIPADPSGIAGADRGIAVNLGGTLQSYTNINDGDFAYYFPPGSEPSAVFPTINCGGANNNGAVVVNLGNLPNATAPGIPASSYGFVRFQGRVK